MTPKVPLIIEVVRVVKGLTRRGPLSDWKLEDRLSSRGAGGAFCASEVRRGTSSIHFHRQVPRSSSHIGHGHFPFSYLSFFVFSGHNPGGGISFVLFVFAGYGAELPPFISIVRCPGRPIKLGPEKHVDGIDIDSVIILRHQDIDMTDVRTLEHL